MTSTRIGPAVGIGAAAGGWHATIASRRYWFATPCPVAATIRRTVSAASGTPRTLPRTIAAC